MSGARGLSITSAASLVIANMIGTGVFVSAGYSLLGLTRPVIVAAWVVGGLLALCGALAYGGLARRYPRSGGEYEYLTRALHPTLGFVAGVVSLFAGFSAPIALSAVAFGTYAAPWVGAVDPRWLGSAALLAATVQHLAGLRVGARVQDAVVAVKLAAIVAFVVAGLVALAGREHAVAAAVAAADADKPFRVAALGVTFYYVMVAYSGWNAAAYVAGEVRDPARSVPRALWLGTGVVTLLYVGLNTVFVHAAADAELAGREAVALPAAAALFGAWAADGIAIVVVVATFTSISAMTMAGPRVYARMAEDRALPRWIGGGVAHRPAILLQAALAAVMLWVGTLAELMEYIGFTLSLCSALAVLGLLRARWREGAAAVPIPGGVLPAWIYVGGVLAIAVAAFRDAIVPSLVSLALLALTAALHHRFARRT